MHEVYRIRTAKGDFAVKALNPRVMMYDGVRENYRRSERIASFVAAAGLPAVCALEIAGDTLHDVGDRTVIVYPWIDGTMLSATSTSPEAGAVVGDLIGRVHALEIVPEDGWPPPSTKAPNDVWDDLIAQSEASGLNSASELRDALPELRAWMRLAQEARTGLEGRWAVGHRDLDPKNVLWSDPTTPWMIDWESAGPVSPAKEIVAAALDWSGHGSDHRRFTAVLGAYRERVELTAANARLGLHAYFDWLGWLEFNLRRALGQITEDPTEQALGVRETENTLRALRLFAANLAELERRCEP